MKFDGRGRARDISSHLWIRERAKVAIEKATYISVSDEALKAQSDFEYFCRYVTRNWEIPAIPAEHHRLWISLLQTDKDSSCLSRVAGQNTDILAPRGAAKSTYLNLFAAWVVGVHTMQKMPIQILYVSYNIDTARQKTTAIKRLVESDEYREIFPMVLKGKKWADALWLIDREYAGISTAGQDEFTVAASGLKGSITSKRSHLVILDDIIKSADDIGNVMIREKLKDNWSSVIRPTMFEGGRAICIGTRFRPDDLHATEFLPKEGIPESQNWIQVEQPALIYNEELEAEESYWEEFYSTEHLLALRAADPFTFAYQYQNKIQKIDTFTIPDEEIRWTEPPVEFDAIAVGVDLAASLKETADYSVFVVVGKKGSEYFVLDCRRGKWQSNSEKIDVLCSLWEDWNQAHLFTPFVTFVEKNAYQGSFQGDFEQLIVLEKYNHIDINNLKIEPIDHKGDKLERLKSVTGLFSASLVWFNPHRRLAPVIHEITNFGSTRHDDCMDALTLALRALKGYRRIDAR